MGDSQTAGSYDNFGLGVVHSSLVPTDVRDGDDVAVETAVVNYCRLHRIGTFGLLDVNITVTLPELSDSSESSEVSTIQFELPIIITGDIESLPCFMNTTDSIDGYMAAFAHAFVPRTTTFLFTKPAFAGALPLGTPFTISFQVGVGLE
jgi:hypothetical protein